MSENTPIRPVTLTGTIVHFQGNGRKLGYPTANLAISTDLRDGVYFGYAELGEYHNHPSIIFVGTPTTVGDTIRRVEAHLLDVPDRDYYGANLTLQVMYYHRANQTFESIDELVATMRADEAKARNWFEQQR